MTDVVPAELGLVRAFANTLDVEDGTDAIADERVLAEWLGERGLLPADGFVTTADVAIAKELRDALRAVLRGHHQGGEDAAALTRLDAIAGRLPLRVAFPSQHAPELAAAGSGVPAALAGILAAVATAAAQGTWERLKICPAEDCQWVFYDQSKNRSRRWCAMRVCGNREKTRSYRTRRRST